MCTNLNSFVISNYPNLESITIGDYVFKAVTAGLTEVTIEKCPKLESISVGNESLKSYSGAEYVLTLSGII